jgi:hypothetical protein
MMPKPDSDMPLLSTSEQSEEALVPISKAATLISHALKLRSASHYALHPVEAVVQYHRDPAEIVGEESHGGIDFQQAEAHYRAGAQGLRLSEIPQLPQQLRELSRLASVDRAGRKSLRQWAEEQGHVIDEAAFFCCWHEQGKRGGAEHQVYHDEECGRWFNAPYAYLHPVTGILAHDLHDENVVRLPETEGLAVIDPYISLARIGTWAALKLAEVGYETPCDDPFIDAA